jgi:hypothetical protein
MHTSPPPPISPFPPSSTSLLERILAELNQQNTSNTAQFSRLSSATATISAELKIVQGVAAQILAILLEPPPIAGAVIALSLSKKKEGTTMLSQTHVASVDLTLQDNGTATGTISFTDAAGQPDTAPAGSTISTTLTTSSPFLGAVIDATGLVITLSPVPSPTPPPFPTPMPVDMTVTAVVTVTPPGSPALGPFTATSEGIDLVAGPIAGAAISF